MAVLAILMAAQAMAQEVRSADRIQNVQLTFHLIEANGFQDDDVEIRPVVTELRKLFRFEGYRLLSKSVLHATANPGSEVSQQVADNDGRMYNINAQVSSAGEDLVVAVTLGLVDVRYQGLIDASVRLQHGKTVVLGSARLSGQSGALILAVTPTIDP
jgi:hypothetical protein